MYKNMQSTYFKNDLFIISDKDSKIRYLEKALDCVAFASGGVPLAAKPGKIVSGQVNLKDQKNQQI